MSTIEKDPDATNQPTGGTTTLHRDAQVERRRDLGRDETNNLIASDKVEGTTVYGTDGKKMGSVKKLMIGKRNGRVEYAVMSFGGFLGIGAEYHPLPWDALDYDTDKGGYVVPFGKDRLKDAPRYSEDREPEWNREYGEQVYGYYGYSY